MKSGYMAIWDDLPSYIQCWIMATVETTEVLEQAHLRAMESGGDK